MEQATNAPGDIENDGYEEHAYTFLNHLADREIDPGARFATGSSLDGRGEFSVQKPPPPAGFGAELQPAPPSAHDGETATDPSLNGGGLVDTLRQAFSEITPG